MPSSIDTPLELLLSRAREIDGVAVLSTALVVMGAYGVMFVAAAGSPFARAVLFKTGLFARALAHMALSREKAGWPRNCPDPAVALDVSSGDVVTVKRVLFVRHGESTWNEIFGDSTSASPYAPVRGPHVRAPAPLHQELVLRGRAAQRPRVRTSARAAPVPAPTTTAPPPAPSTPRRRRSSGEDGAGGCVRRRSARAGLSPTPTRWRAKNLHHRELEPAARRRDDRARVLGPCAHGREDLRALVHMREMARKRGQHLRWRGRGSAPP